MAKLGNLKINADDVGNTNAVKQADAVHNADLKVDDYGGERKVEQNVDIKKCPGCGAALRFDPAAQALYCEHCGTSVGIVNEGIVYEQILDFNIDNLPVWAGETRVFRCANCGGESVFERNEFSKICPFCGSPSVTTLEDMAGVRPNAVIPFAFDSARAEQLYHEWAKKRFFAPGAFRKHHPLDDFRSYYSPAWTFDSKTFSSYRGIVGDYYTVTVGSGNNRHTERRIRYRPVSGVHDCFFDDLIINSSGQLEGKIFSKILPFVTAKAVPYASEYLAGYVAERYKVGLNDGWELARKQMDDTVRRQIVSSLHCDVVQTLTINTAYNDKTFKYLLLPLYLVRHKFKEKLYKVYINAQTSKIAGQYPKSVGKILGLIFGIIGAAAVIGLIIYLLNSNGII
ncbi:MAG: hydrogenase maturation nickel metallochaperone HypA [Clostridiales bacterium]|jgi:Zn finger protein HypA/HybF involved in hydrogenase expression|nr:hydrogenase maturation nickel metallochaperone HypA [Clostridiales bacterium]